MILLSHQDEIKLGEKSFKETIKKMKVIENTNDAKRVNKIGMKIAKVVNRDDYNWEFKLVENDAINAFCLPGGKVVVYTGILQIAENDDQLATVIAHEIAHALARHGAERVSTSMLKNGLQIVGNIILASQAPQYADAFNKTYDATTQYGLMLPYGRLQENEADEIGIHLMHKAGYDVYEALKFWENMNKDKKQKLEFLSTHPNSNTRIDNITRIINNLNKKNSESDLNNKLLGKRVR